MSCYESNGGKALRTDAICAPTAAAMTAGRTRIMARAASAARSAVAIDGSPVAIRERPHRRGLDRIRHAARLLLIDCDERVHADDAATRVDQWAARVSLEDRSRVHDDRRSR